MREKSPGDGELGSKHHRAALSSHSHLLSRDYHGYTTSQSASPSSKARAPHDTLGNAQYHWLCLSHFNSPHKPHAAELDHGVSYQPGVKKQVPL